MLRIAHIVQASADVVSGPRTSVTSLARATTQLQLAQSAVYSVTVSESFAHGGVRIEPIGDFRASDWDVVVFAGLYDRAYPRIARTLMGCGTPYVISPRASLMKESFRKSLHKKMIFLSTVGRGFIKNALGVHFLSTDERMNSIGLGLPSFIAGNGVSGFRDGATAGERERLMLYIGRYDIFHKGLDRLIEALGSVQVDLAVNGWRVALYGSDLAGGQQYVVNQVRRRQLGDVVSVGDAVWGKQKSLLLRRAAVFIHASRYEGQPQAVMEAMAHGCAIVVTPGANMSEAVAAGGGWQAAASPAGMARILREVVTHDSIGQVGERARALAIERFQWSAQAVLFVNGLEALLRDSELRRRGD